MHGTRVNIYEVTTWIHATVDIYNTLQYDANAYMTVTGVPICHLIWHKKTRD